jgi:hypothetical protein
MPSHAKILPIGEKKVNKRSECLLGELEEVEVRCIHTVKKTTGLEYNSVKPHNTLLEAEYEDKNDSNIASLNQTINSNINIPIFFPEITSSTNKHRYNMVITPQTSSMYIHTANTEFKHCEDTNNNGNNSGTSSNSNTTAESYQSLNSRGMLYLANGDLSSAQPLLSRYVLTEN